MSYTTWITYKSCIRIAYDEKIILLYYSARCISLCMISVTVTPAIIPSFILCLCLVLLNVSVSLKMQSKMIFHLGFFLTACTNLGCHELVDFLLEISKAIVKYSQAPTLSEIAAKQQQQNCHSNVRSRSCYSICVTTWSINYHNSSGAAANFTNDIQSNIFSGE